MFNPRIYENSRPDGFPVLEVTGEEVDRGERFPFVPLQRTYLRGTVTGPLTALHLTQVFGYDRATYDGSIEAYYRFPLPGDAAVQGVTVRFGAVEIVAALQERSTAEATYAEAKAAGRQAALATRESPDVFTLQVTGIQPDQPVTIETHYVQLARVEPGGFSATGERIPQWSLRIPLTTAPRYVRADEQEGRWAKGQPLALLRDPGHRFQLDLTFQGTIDVRSPTHRLTTTSISNSALSSPASSSPASAISPLQVQLADGEVLPDRDCLLRWSPSQETTTPTLQLLTYQDTPDVQAQDAHNDEPMLYFLALIAPPSQRVAGGNRREATLLVDHSGSMRGAKWSAADWAVERFLGDLDAQDAFALAIFHNKTRWFADGVETAHPERTAGAVEWLHAQTDSGGTELGVALEQALQLPRPQPAPDTTLTRHLLVITDAAVSDGARILRLADAEAERPDRRRISVLCIDAAPNAFLANALAERGGGVARFLTSDPAQDDIVTALDDLLLEWSEPLLANMQLTINRPGVMVSGYQPPANQAEQRDHETVIDLGDLPAGRAQWIVGRLPPSAVAATRGRTPEELTLSLSVDHAGERRTVAKLRTETADIVGTADMGTEDMGNDQALSEKQLPERASASGSPAIKALFGARRVNALEFLMNANLDEAQLSEQLRRLGYNPEEVLRQQPAGQVSVYAENRQRQHAAALHDLLVREALRYGLASAETAFAATRTEGGEPVTATVQVANALPAGWSGDFALAGMMPQLYTSRAMPPTLPVDAAGYRSASAPDRGLGGQRHQMLAQSFMAPPSASPSFAAGQASAPDADRNTTERQYTIFTGVPRFEGQTALLFAGTESDDRHTRGNLQLPPQMTITAMTFEVADSPLQPDRSTTIAIYIDDLITPRATIRLVDLLRHGTRPLNLHRPAAVPLRITLDDPTGSLRRTSVKFSLTITVH